MLSRRWSVPCTSIRGSRLRARSPRASLTGSWRRRRNPRDSRMRRPDCRNGCRDAVSARRGKKLSLGTPKAQPTRYRILGVLSRPEYQLVLLDTPGLGAPAGRRLNQSMRREASAGIAGADAAILVMAAPPWPG